MSLWGQGSCWVDLEPAEAALAIRLQVQFHRALVCWLCTHAGLMFRTLFVFGVEEELDQTAILGVMMMKKTTMHQTKALGHKESGPLSLRM